MNKLVLVVVLSALSVVSARAETVEVIAPLFVNLIEESGDGVYQQVLREAARRAGLQYRERVYPLKRALSNFASHRGLCIYGLADPVISQAGPGQVVSSYPLGVAKLYVFTRQGEPSVTSVEQLLGRSVGGTLGYEYYYQRIIDKGISIQYESNEKSLIRMLFAGRIDSILGFLPDYNPDLQRLSYAPESPVMVVYDSVNCRNTLAGRAFVDKLSDALRQMKREGALKAILGVHYLEFESSPSP